MHGTPFRADQSLPVERHGADQDSTVGILAAALLNLSPGDRAKLAALLVAGDGKPPTG